MRLSAAQRSLRYLLPIGLMLALLLGLGIGQSVARSPSSALLTEQREPDIAAVPTAVPGGPGFLMLGQADFRYGFVSDREGDNYFSTAPVHLPQGMQIVKITAYYSDTSTLDTPAVTLVRQNLSTVEQIGSVPFPASFNSGQNVVSADVTSPLAVIDNSRYEYRVRALNIPITEVLYFQVRVDYAAATNLPLVVQPESP